MKLYKTQPEKEKAVLVTVSLRSEERRGWSPEDISAELKELTDSSFNELIKSSDKFVAVMFYTTACSNCRLSVYKSPRR